MKKTIYICLIVLIIFGIGYVIPKFFVNQAFGGRDNTYGYRLEPNGQIKTVYFCGGSEEDPDILVANHLNSPIHRLLIIKLIFTKEDLVGDKNIYKAYTLFGIPISTVELDCKTGGIQTIKGL